MPDMHSAMLFPEPPSTTRVTRPGAPDEHAEQRFRALVAVHARALLGYAARRTERPEDAADVVAEVLAIGWRRLDDVPAGDGARPWLFGVARHVLSNHRRSSRRQGRLVERLRAELAALPPSERPTADVLAVRDAMEALAPDDRELLRLTCWEGFTPAEVAASMGIPAGTVRSRLHRARSQLRAQLTVPGTAARVGERSGSTGQVTPVERPLDTDREDQP